MPTSAPAPALAEESDESLATENDSDGEVAAMAIAETEEVFAVACADLRYLAKGVSYGDDARVPDSGIFCNKVTGTAHQVSCSDPTKSACGLIMNPLTFYFQSDPTALIGCTLCWRSGCAHWVAADNDTQELAEAAAFATDEDFAAIDDGFGPDA